MNTSPVARSTILVDWPMNTPIDSTDPLPTRTPSTTSDRAPMKQSSRSEEHTSELQSLMRNSYAVFCLTIKQPTDARHTHIPTTHPTRVLILYYISSS